MPEEKKKILVLSDYYLPGFRAGGGLRTIVNMVDRLSGRYDFWIVTRDHDSRLDKTPYKIVNINEWNLVGGAHVYYFSQDNLKLSTIEKLIKEASPDAVYMNSFFATPANFFLFLRWRGKLKTSAIMAPCGELIAAAMQFKTLKKKVHIFASKLAGLHKGLIWKATTELEKIDIEKVLGKKDDMYVAADLPPKTIFPDYEPSLKPAKNSGELKLVFLARFVKTKNFAFLLELLDNVSGNISIDLIGDLEDKNYWDECLEGIKKLPANITVNYLGAIDNRLVLKKLAGYHFLILPTLNENFGHVFLEALSAGCPLIISDRTPWLELEEKGVGWDLPLEDKQRWKDVLQKCVAMDIEEYRNLSARAREFAESWLADESLEKDTITVIEAAIAANKNR
jgi:glycosyltransferase involved in cell wall biosynthesis